MWKYLVSVVFILGSCSLDHNTQPVKLLGEAQGTYYSIIYFDTQYRDFQVEIDSILDAFDQSVSLWVPESILSKVNNNNKDITLDDHFINNFLLSKKVSQETNGAFDFTIGPLVKAWGFGYDNHKEIDSNIIDSLLKIVGYEKVNIINNHVVKQYQNSS